MRGVLRPGDLSIDAGAYRGGYTYWMRHEVGAAGAVVAFEPQPTCAAFLRRAVSAFAWTNVRVEEVGLSDRRRVGVLHAPGMRPSRRASLVVEHSGVPARRDSVRLAALDDCLPDEHRGRRVDFMKCDVEGHELEVFKGAASVLRAHRPALLFESEARHRPDGSVREVFGHLERLGYRGSFFWNGSPRRVRDFDPNRHQMAGSRPYVNNFMFVQP